MKPTLVVLAAGMGSRYGGLKQIDAFGPNGEAIIDYSIYDAIEAGFGKVVFIIREHFKDQFVAFFSSKFEDKIQVEFVTQELDKLPAGDYEIHPEREKPWGTAHAVYVAKDVVKEPFAVINADDFYGKEAIQAVAKFLTALDPADQETNCVISYYLRNTLSDHGTVNRGVCFEDEKGNLTKVEECIKIAKQDDGQINYEHGGGPALTLTEDTLVSMNLWGFVPEYFNLCERGFKTFLKERGNELKSEYFIPLLVMQMIEAKTGIVKVIPSDSPWFGVTYQEDRPFVIKKLTDLIDSGVYPEKLWS